MVKKLKPKLKKRHKTPAILEDVMSVMLGTLSVPEAAERHQLDEAVFDRIVQRATAAVSAQVNTETDAAAGDARTQALVDQRRALEMQLAIANAMQEVLQEMEQQRPETP